MFNIFDATNCPIMSTLLNSKSRITELQSYVEKIPEYGVRESSLFQRFNLVRKGSSAFNAIFIPEWVIGKYHLMPDSSSFDIKIDEDLRFFIEHYERVFLSFFGPKMKEVMRFIASPILSKIIKEMDLLNKELSKSTIKELEAKIKEVMSLFSGSPVNMAAFLFALKINSPFRAAWT